MLVFTIRDDRGEQIGAGDYNLLFLAGKKYKPELLPNGFLEDKQMNDTSGSLVFYLNCTKMADVPDGQFGFRITARPSQGFAYYCAGAFYPDGRLARALLTPNQTTYIEIKLRRLVDTQVFRFDSAGRKAARFRKIRPSGEIVDDF
ncbi:MAG: hypothetical protein CR981_02285 [Proteobacteria bacterium]|nr:MAG: hypothetical protein CR981_02285 [Pseudomonadota bacterium]